VASGREVQTVNLPSCCHEQPRLENHETMSTSDASPSMRPHHPLAFDQEVLDKTTSSSSRESRDGSEQAALRSPPSDTTASDYRSGEIVGAFASDESRHMLQSLFEIFSENVLAKMLRVAGEALESNVSRQPNLGLCAFSDRFVLESSNGVSRVCTSEWRRRWEVSSARCKLLDMRFLPGHSLPAARACSQVSTRVPIPRPPNGKLAL
jgi:hypothetical protein